MALSCGDNAGHPLANALVGYSGLTEHQANNVPIEHTGNRNAFSCDVATCCERGRVFERETVMRACSREQRAIDIEKKEGLGQSTIVR